MPASKPIISKFQAQVYAAAQAIPKGMVTTYQLLAAAIGCRSAQAVGQALRRNPTPPAIPCHRIIRSDLTIGGFAGATAGREIEKKLALLAAEGVTFADHKLREPERVYKFDKKG